MNIHANSTRTRSWGRRAATAVATVAIAALALSGCTSETRRTAEIPSLGEGKLPDDIATQMNDATTSAIAASGASGAIVGVWAPWSGSWVAGVGTAATGSESPVTTDMSFRIGSVTREMTCDVLYGMVADGTVKLDDPVSKYVIGVNNLTDVTLEQLCDSTSGIGVVPNTVRDEFTRVPDRQWRPRELASFGLSRAVTNAPGEKYSSSDTGYLLLGLALEQASGLTAPEYIEEYVTDPLKLTSTQLPGPKAAKPTPAPTLTGQLPPKVEGGFNCAEPKDVTELSSSVGYTEGGVTSTITDLGQYARALAARSLGSKDDGRFEPVMPSSAKAPSWNNAAGGSRILGSLIGQYGTIPGYDVAAFSDPASGLTVAVALNSSAAPSTASILAQLLAAIAMKAPATEGQTAPTTALPWTPEQYTESLANMKTCVAPPA